MGVGGEVAQRSQDAAHGVSQPRGCAAAAAAGRRLTLAHAAHDSRKANGDTVATAGGALALPLLLSLPFGEVLLTAADVQRVVI